MVFHWPRPPPKHCTSLPWQSSFFILICLRIPKSEPTSNGLGSANAENRLIWRARLWSHLALNTLSKQDSLTAGRSVWHVHPSLGHTTQPDSSQRCRLVTLSQYSSLCVGLDMTSRVANPWNHPKVYDQSTQELLNRVFLFKQNV